MAKEFNHLDDLQQQMRTAVGGLLRKAAFDTQAGAQSRVKVQTGNLKNSIYVVTADHSAPPGGIRDAVDEGISASDELEVYVAVAAAYGLYVEMGTSRAPAQPYLRPAFDAVRPSLIAALQSLEDRLKR